MLQNIISTSSKKVLLFSSCYMYRNKLKISLMGGKFLGGGENRGRIFGRKMLTVSSADKYLAVVKGVELCCLTVHREISN